MHMYVFWFWHSMALSGMNYGTYKRKRELFFDSCWKTAERKINRPFARSGHMVRNKLRWDASYTVGFPKQRNLGLDWYEFFCFGNPTVNLASQRN